MKKILSESLQEYRELYEDAEVFKNQRDTGITAGDVDPKEFLVGYILENTY